MTKEELIKHLRNLPKNAEIEIAIRSRQETTLKIRKIIRVRQVTDQQPQKHIAWLICCTTLKDEIENLEVLEKCRRARLVREKRKQERQRQAAQGSRANGKDKATDSHSESQSQGEAEADSMTGPKP